MKLLGKSRYKPFCAERRSYTEYEVKIRIFESDSALGLIKYSGFEAHCKKCEMIISTPEI